MVVAKEGFENVFQSMTMEKQILMADKDVALKLAYEEVNARYAEREALIDEILAKVSVVLPDPVVETETAPEVTEAGLAGLTVAQTPEEDDILDY